MKDTVFIIGAGASMPYGLPSGGELIKRIILFTNPIFTKENVIRNTDASFKSSEFSFGFIQKKFELLRSVGIPAENIISFGEALRLSGQPSIDNFIHLRPEYEQIGKLSIVIGISMSENPNSIFGCDDDNWYEYLWHSICSSKEEFKKNKFSIITFNYDRSFEFYLSTVLENSFNLSDEEVESYMNYFPIIHVYGSLGSVFDTQDDFTFYQNGKMTPKDLLNSSSRITTIHEYTGTETAHKVNSTLDQAKNVYFIGFGYHKENMSLLNLSDSKNVVGSAYGLVKREINFIMSQNHYLGQIVNQKNLEYLRNFVELK